MLVWLCLLTFVVTADGMLYPQESETREVVSLDGIWKFKWDKNHEGFSDIWFSKELQNWTSMPVPSSFNDIPVSSSLRDHVGWVWYQRSFYAPTAWLKHNLRVFIRLGSVHYAANVWLKGELVTSHRGGALPFQGEVTQSVNYGGENIVTVAANNTLSQHTIPQGTVLHTNNTNRYPLDYTKYSIVPDYFNYAGIHRPVVLYTVPQTFIDDITVHTDINDTTGVVHYTVSYNVGEYGVVDPACHVELLDHQGVMVSNGTGLVGTLYIPEANFWWPRLTHSRPGYLYTFKVSLIDNDELLDVYRLCIGLRTLQWNSTTLLLNKRPIYLAGFGKHEDANLRGKGLDNALLVRDYNLMTWLGANSFRTSHYPYAEETLLMADQEGFMVIDESPACSLDGFDVILLEEHKVMLQEMVLRDKNHPSVIMWSLANEPRTDKPEAEDYFRSILEFTRGLDNSRPITFVTSQGVHIDKAVQYMDIICVNRYRAWYSDPGRLDLISYQVERELTNWHDRFKKPVLVTEYGAGAISGMHVLPAVMWTEDYLMLTLKQHFPVFDKLRGEGFLLGEMIWNFADFQTPQEVIRPVRCVKGLFTRERQPKMAAHLTRWRYWSLAANMTGIALPADLMFIGVP